MPLKETWLLLCYNRRLFFSYEMILSTTKYILPFLVIYKLFE